MVTAKFRRRFALVTWPRALLYRETMHRKRLTIDFSVLERATFRRTSQVVPWPGHSLIRDSLANRVACIVSRLRCISSAIDFLFDSKGRLIEI